MQLRSFIFAALWLPALCAGVTPMQGYTARAVRGEPYGDLTFQAPLTTNLFAQYPVGVAGTLTRATTASVTDFEGVVKTAVSGEARFHGARRVQNLVTNSFLANNGTTPNGWSANGQVGNGTITFGTLNGENTVTCAGTGTADRAYIQQSYSVVAGRQYRLSVTIIAVSGTFAHDIVKVANSVGQVTGDVGWNHVGGQTGLVSTGVLTATVSGTVVLRFGFGTDNTSTNIASVTLYRPMFEDVTGQTNQNVSDYVSTGQFSSPYHGAGVDGVRYFAYENGNTTDGNGYVAEAKGADISPTVLRGFHSEKQATNLALRSAEFDNAGVWVPTGLSSVTANATAAPSGLPEADKLIEDGGNSRHEVIQSYTKAASALNHTFSIYAKKGDTRTKVRLSMDDNAGNGAYVDGDTSDCSLGTVTGIGTPFTQLHKRSYTEGAGSGWCRFVLMVVTNTSTSLRTLVSLLDAGGNVTFTGDGASGLHVTWAQLEANNSSSFANGESSYIPTTTASVQRNGDLLTFPNAMSLQVPPVGTLFLEMFTVNINVGARSFLWSIGDDSGTDRLYVAGAPSGTNLFPTMSCGSASVGADFGLAWQARTAYKVGITWGPFGCSNAFTGAPGTKANTTSGPIKKNSTFQIGAPSTALSGGPGAAIRNVRIFDRSVGHEVLRAGVRQ